MKTKISNFWIFIMILLNYSLCDTTKTKSNPYILLNVKGYNNMETIKDAYLKQKEKLTISEKLELEEAYNLILNFHWIKEGEDYFDVLFTLILKYIFIMYLAYRIKGYVMFSH